MNKLIQKYNTLYQTKDVFGSLPVPIVKRAVKYMGNKVLDFGAGQGRNAIYLAKKGFDVYAVDISDVALKSLPKEITTSKTVKKGSYDVVVSTVVLHHFTRADALKTIKKLQSITKREGIHVISTFTKNSDFYTEGMFYLKDGELKKLYKGWKILEYSTKYMKVYQKSEDGKPMVNQVAYMIAQKT